MRKISGLFVGYSVLGLVSFGANAAGTYYNGNYMSTRQNVTRPAPYQDSSAFSRGYGYANYAQNANGQVGNTGQRAVNNAGNGGSQGSMRPTQGFVLDAGLSYQNAMWQFDMEQSGSILHYDNINWAVFDASGHYFFTSGNTAMQIDAGLQYGKQIGESTMVDDDITNGGYLITGWIGDTDGDGYYDDYIGAQVGHAVSVGTSKDGDMLGLNAGLGLTDYFKWGNLKITPSVGYRYLKYKLKTSSNYGVSVDSSACFEIDGEIQCDPALIMYSANGIVQQVVWRDDISTPIEIASGAEYIDTQGTYYFEQPGVSHSYEVEWSGPYLALDAFYDINKNNYANARVELGLPSYTAIGDQPYRFDWQHPKSVEDTGGFGDAWHFGLGANWVTALTDSVALSLGVTFDYYTVSGATAKTYLNGTYYESLYSDAVDVWEDAGYSEDDMLNADFASDNGITLSYALKAYQDQAIDIAETYDMCSGWVCESQNEIKSFYRSLGLRVGINAKF